MTDQRSVKKSLAELVSLEGRNAVITGAARGIGAAIAARLAEAGADLFLIDRNADQLEHTARELARYGGRVSSSILDITRSEALQAAAADAVTQLGGIDIWVNNAGISPRVGTVEMTDEQWDAVMDLNLRAAFIGARSAAQHMQASGRRGVIVNITSSTVKRVSANPLHYRVSKQGLVAMTQSLAVELGRNGIRVVAIAPTLVETPWVAELRARGYGEGFDKFVKRLPLGRIGSPDDVARVVLFAVSELASFVTGTVLEVDGGECCV
jgi:NAD(P)-dependent dehydrogenase (short-subunit alcohol dehydrogenase family)